MADTKLVVCVNERLGYAQKSCGGNGSRKLMLAMQQMLEQEGMDIPVVEQVCLGRCEEGIAMRIAPGGEFFTEVKKKDLTHILQALKDFHSSHL